jgi:2-methylisocitrate lyase-like PEP mutase family enzyme
VVLYPTVAVRTVARALEDLYAHLRANGTSADSPAPMVSFAERNSITGFNEYEDLAARAANRREQTDE